MAAPDGPRGSFLSGAYLTAGYWAPAEISAATMALIGSLQPLMTAFLSGPVLGDRFRPPQWIGFFSRHGRGRTRCRD
ncbi:MAG: hypothetical protein CM1200mP20_00920 [Pseudomonadota bacterium]|nr:MAG: hypothetical protein CM1200mP20_00920 [Pseudomonadota bacterium]